MHYTIAEMDEIHGDVKLNFDKKGDYYTVGLYHKILREYTHKDFTDGADALARFLKLTSYILTGRYSYSDRKRLLLE